MYTNEPLAAGRGLTCFPAVRAGAAVYSVLCSNCVFPELADVKAEDVVTSAFKWLRAVATDEYTGVHVDRVYLGRVSADLPQLT